MHLTDGKCRAALGSSVQDGRRSRRKYAGEVRPVGPDGYKDEDLTAVSGRAALYDDFAVCIKQKKYPGREALILYHNGFLF